MNKNNTISRTSYFKVDDPDKLRGIMNYTDYKLNESADGRFSIVACSKIDHYYLDEVDEHIDILPVLQSMLCDNEIIIIFENINDGLKYIDSKVTIIDNIKIKSFTMEAMAEDYARKALRFEGDMPKFWN